VDAAAVRIVAEALRRHRPPFSRADNLADDDALRRLRELDSATLTAYVGQPAFLAEQVDDLGQVVSEMSNTAATSAMVARRDGSTAR
jgi:hypothetical protein